MQDEIAHDAHAVGDTHLQHDVIHSFQLGMEDNRAREAGDECGGLADGRIRPAGIAKGEFSKEVEAGGDELDVAEAGILGEGQVSIGQLAVDGGKRPSPGR